METHTCPCTACHGAAFTAPVGYVTGTPKQVRDMIHNYAQMIQNPVMAPSLERRGVVAA